MPLKSNDEVILTDSVFPSMPLLFQLPDEAIREMLGLAGILVKDTESEECGVNNKGIE